MTVAISRHILIQSLISLGKRLQANVPEEIVKAAIDANPWFTAHFIQHSIEVIADWLRPTSLQQILAHYPETAAQQQRIGIIAAGNVPFVGFHDVLMSILSGHQAHVKCAHQDEILMKWIVAEWVEVLPALEPHIRFYRQLKAVDYLIATGSNNTARYIQSEYGHIPHLLRKNRFSVAVLDGNLSEKQLHQLSDDIFLHNGLGCRNVSNLLVLPDFDMEKWKYILAEYPLNKLNPNYLKKVSLERVRLQMMEASFIDTPYVLLKQSNTFDFGLMGVLSLQWVESHKQAQQLIATYHSEIQCVAGDEVLLGQTQCPGLLTFADAVDTIGILTRL